MDFDLTREQEMIRKEVRKFAQKEIAPVAADLEPLVRLIEQTPRDRLLEEVSARVHRGAGYREVLGALLLATCSQPPGLLERILASGELRIVTRNSPDAYYLGSQGPEGPSTCEGGVATAAGTRD